MRDNFHNVHYYNGVISPQQNAAEKENKDTERWKTYMFCKSTVFFKVKKEICNVGDTIMCHVAFYFLFLISVLL